MEDKLKIKIMGTYLGECTGWDYDNECFVFYEVNLIEKFQVSELCFFSINTETGEYDIHDEETGLKVLRSGKLTLNLNNIT